MKLLTTLAVLAALAMPATAQVDDSMCPDMGAMAVEIMAARQAGMAISTDEARARAAADFRNDVELACYRGMGR